MDEFNVRIGEVVAVDTALARVQVQFDELEHTSDWLPVAQHGAGSSKSYWLPGINEQVVCAFYSDATEEGVVLGSYYRAGSPPPIAGEGVFYTQYPDGSIIKWDNGELTITATADVNITAAAGVNITADAHITGDVNITGELVVTGDITANIVKAHNFVLI